MEQKIIYGLGSIDKLPLVLDALNCHKYLLVHDKSLSSLSFKENLMVKNVPCAFFSDFTPNPLYEDVLKGIDTFHKMQCDTIVAVGGGSTIDMAKCIKLFNMAEPDTNFLGKEYYDTKIPLVAIPTTAGTGSESTQFAVIYYNGEKQSITHPSIIPNCVILDHSVLYSLPQYQKRCTLLDALCQGIESWWSVNATSQSIAYSQKAVTLIRDNYHSYLEQNDTEATRNIMIAANYAGRAINITQTTAPHAMSYKLTSLFHLPHGHAVAICLPAVWNHMINHSEHCIDPRGKNYLNKVFRSIAQTFGQTDPESAVAAFCQMLHDLEISAPVLWNPDTLDLLADSVNPIRLKNNPVSLDRDVLYTLYAGILSRQTNS